MSSLVERAGGNPLFVRELVWAARHGEQLDALPDTVERLLTARIDTLDPIDRVVLRYAAVVGPSFDLALLREIVADAMLGESLADIGTADDELDLSAPLREFLVDAGDGRFAFRHDLVRVTAYEGLSFGRRAEIHGAVGTAIERRLGESADEEAALLSLHFHTARDFARSWRYSVSAGRRAQAGFANVVAAELYERALEAAAPSTRSTPSTSPRSRRASGTSASASATTRAPRTPTSAPARSFRTTRSSRRASPGSAARSRSTPAATRRRSTPTSSGSPASQSCPRASS